MVRLWSLNELIHLLNHQSEKIAAFRGERKEMSPHICFFCMKKFFAMIPLLKKNEEAEMVQALKRRKILLQSPLSSFSLPFLLDFDSINELVRSQWVSITSSQLK